ncbi:MAG TPA: hypothetical protein VM390_06260, partial [Acidimicrobiales bacterium]|nr:hypothetical protein [Acidimicrobiales bacterium]
MTDHPDLDALSAAVDGDDPAGAVAGHVAACGDCRARQDALRRARRAVATPVPPLPGPARERLVAAALAAAVEGDADAGQAAPGGPLP